MQRRALSFVLLVHCAMLTGLASADSLYENFESGLGGWTGKNGGSYSAQIVADPLNPTNHAVDFTGLANGGDIFSNQILPGGQAYQFQFAYLGVPNGMATSDLGGFFGIAPDTSGLNQIWLAGTHVGYTGGTSVTVVPLIDDGHWHTYDIDYTPTTAFSVVLEQWVGSNGSPGQAFFDSVSAQPLNSAAAPLPSCVSTCGAILLSLLLFMCCRAKCRARIDGRSV